MTVKEDLDQLSSKFYVAMAPTVGEYVQSDYLYLMKLKDGRVIGFSAEFEYGTIDVPGATKREYVQTPVNEQHSNVKWFGLTLEIVKGWVPATLAEIQAHDFDKSIIGWKADMNPAGKVNPLD
jgi:hypothetical protein